MSSLKSDKTQNKRLYCLADRIYNWLNDDIYSLWKCLAVRVDCLFVALSIFLSVCHPSCIKRGKQTTGKQATLLSHPCRFLFLYRPICDCVHKRLVSFRTAFVCIFLSTEIRWGIQEGSRDSRLAYYSHSYFAITPVTDSLLWYLQNLYNSNARCGRRLSIEVAIQELIGTTVFSAQGLTTAAPQQETCVVSQWR